MPAVLHERQPLLGKKATNGGDYPVTVHPPSVPAAGSSETDDESLYIKDEHDLDRYFVSQFHSNKMMKYKLTDIAGRPHGIGFSLKVSILYASSW